MRFDHITAQGHMTADIDANGTYEHVQYRAEQRASSTNFKTSFQEMTLYM